MKKICYRSRFSASHSKLNKRSVTILAKADGVCDVQQPVIQSDHIKKPQRMKMCYLPCLSRNSVDSSWNYLQKVGAYFH